MNNQLKLEARAILLEQFNDGISDVNKALKRVAEEIGPKTISEAEAISWYHQIKNNDTSINFIIPKSRQKLIANGTFAKSKRALICEIPFNNYKFTYVKCINGTDHRFQIVRRCNVNGTYWIVDTFTNVQKRLTIDISAIEGFEADGILYWRSFYFDSKIGFYGELEQMKNNLRSFLYCGELDFVNCCLKINTVTEIPGSYWSTHLYPTEAPFRVVTYNKNVASKISILDYEWNNGHFVHQKTIDLENRILFSTVQDGKLFGWFVIDRGVSPWLMDGTMFVEVSLADGSKTEHKIEEKNRLTEEVDVETLRMWIGDKFLIALYNRADRVSTIAQFDASKKEWKKTEMETEGRIEGMATTNGSLIVHSKKPNRQLIQTYRFNYTQTDSLANLTWRSMRRYSRFNPQFQKWFVSKMPKESRFHSLW